MKQTKVYLSCASDQKEYYKQKAMEIYQESAEIMPELTEEVDLVLVIEPAAIESKVELEKAFFLNVSVVHVTERFVPEDFYNELLKR